MKMFVLGMLAWQLVVFLVGVISHEDEEKIAVTGYGIFFLIIFIIGLFIKFLIRAIHRRKYARYLFFGKDGNLTRCFFMDKKIAKRLRLVSENEPTFPFCVKRSQTARIDAPIPKTEILTEKDITFGGKGYSAEFLAKFIREVE